MPYVNHLTLPVDDAERAAAFYADWFGAEVVPSPRFHIPVAWVLLGRVQLHLVHRPATTSAAYHFGIAIEDRERFEGLYRRAEREGILDTDTFGHHLFEAVGGAVQLYLNDPAGNLVECDYPAAGDLAPEIHAQLQQWGGGIEQSAWNERARLFVAEGGETGR